MEIAHLEYMSNKTVSPVKAYKQALVAYHLFGPSTETQAAKLSHAIRQAHKAYIQDLMHSNPWTKERATSCTLEIRSKVLDACNAIINAD